MGSSFETHMVTPLPTCSKSKSFFTHFGVPFCLLPSYGYNPLLPAYIFFFFIYYYRIIYLTLTTCLRHSLTLFHSATSLPVTWSHYLFFAYKNKDHLHISTHSFQYVLSSLKCILEDF